MKSVFSVLYNNVPININVTHQTKVSNVKEQLSVKLGIPPSSIILSYNGKKIHNSNYLYYYFCSDDSETIVFTATTTLKSDKNNSIQFFGGIETPEEMKNAITEVTSGLQNYDPKRAEEGMGGTYFLKNYNGENIYCFKPQDEEPMAPNNPHDFVGPFGSTGLRDFIKSGWSCIREVAAYYMDKDHFSGVPATTLAEMSSKSFNYNNCSGSGDDDNNYIPKLGSLQKFVECDDLLIDRSSKILSVMDIHKIGILDIRILNLDRNEENILLKQMGRSLVTNEVIWKAIPIDHGYSIPSKINIGWCDWCWFEYPQAKVPFDKETKEYIKSINIDEDIIFLREKLKINEVCLKNLRISNLLLQIGVERGLTLYEIAYMMLRLDTNMERPSILEECCDLSERLLDMSLKNIKERGTANTTSTTATAGTNEGNNTSYKMISNNHNGIDRKYNIHVNTNFDEVIQSPEISPQQSAGSVLSELNDEINKKQPPIVPNQSPLSDTFLLIDTPQMSPMLVGSFMSNNNNNNNLNDFSLDDNCNGNDDKELSFGSFNNEKVYSFSMNNSYSVNNNNNSSIFESIIPPPNDFNNTVQTQSKSEPSSSTKKYNNNFSLVTSPLLQPSFEISMDKNNKDSLLFTDEIYNPKCTNKPPLNPDDLPVATTETVNCKSEELEEAESGDKCTPLVSKLKVDTALVRTCSYTANSTLLNSLSKSNSNNSVSNIKTGKRSKTPKNKRMKKEDNEKEKLFFFHLKEVLINRCDIVKQRNLIKNRKVRNYSVA